MSTDQVLKYRELYSKYIELSLNLHNYHQSYLKLYTKKTAKEIRNTIRDLRIVLHEMLKLNPLVTREQLDIWKAEVANRKEIRPDGTVKLKRNKNVKRNNLNLRSTQNTI